jgi:hypothetical protein
MQWVVEERLLLRALFCEHITCTSLFFIPSRE